MYSENATKIINNKGKAEVFIKTLSSRLDQVEKDSKRKPIEKVLKHMNLLF